jgi:Uma2 family endonuclease
VAVKLPEAPARRGDAIVIHFPEGRALSDAELLSLSARNRHLRFERGPQGDLIVMSPTGGESSRRNAELIFQLMLWAKQRGGGAVFESSGGFRLPDGAVRSPDAAWVQSDRLARLSSGERERFLPLAPDFAAELRSPTDDLEDLQRKMTEYLQNGVRLGWLIDPEARRVHVYTPEGASVLEHPETVSGEPVLPGFELQMLELWAN